ncbi:MAG TPA: Tm-1-like ATP-binding domain-containing protein [Thermomicrobiales bacterium]|nr:Tm-1-like ATP-binding domain-containing protein [Thermomicrobiales bacterium]
MADRPTVVLVGTLDTKGVEYDYLRRRVREAGCDALLVDVGSGGPPQVAPDIGREEVARAAGADAAELARRGDRGLAVATMARGATVIARDLHQRGLLHGILGLGGSGGSALATAAMRALPIGVPKLMVSTMASGDTRPYVGTADIAMLYSVVDIAGINRVSARILANAAAAIAGMAHAYAAAGAEAPGQPLVAATMFGVTTPCVTEARRRLEELGYEVLVFHAVGTGGQALEALVDAGYLAGVLDATTTELADELVGGVLSAGPHRLEAAGARGVPQVVSLGALDMVNFGPLDSVPERFRGRRLYRHNPTVTLMRTTPTECAELGRVIARKLNAATGPVALFLPLRGVSAIAVAGGVFHDPEADRALLTTLRAELRPDIEVHELDLDINDARFARAMAEQLDQLIRAGAGAATRQDG